MQVRNKYSHIELKPSHIKAIETASKVASLISAEIHEDRVADLEAPKWEHREDKVDLDRLWLNLEQLRRICNKQYK